MLAASTKASPVRSAVLLDHRSISPCVAGVQARAAASNPETEKIPSTFVGRFHSANDEPQPQVDDAFGFFTTKYEPIRS